ncbi:heparan sulfate glucosamine 3-O-sulfotransferase 3B1-like [Xenia sp. Carnegie-2017]|uniref:heparan sulfate glucosamine 3-O-sulfotransferase 3B1-like n=1 Tax=Xenia sp. Carnegie-2017 TaxID=2897299 RepID=UPI001F0463B2|nr:heparan sulfate glucosamine 3-O-sulfotransferase 3B1-like [Xenia sp. Carnegie-2017]
MFCLCAKNTRRSFEEVATRQISQVKTIVNDRWAAIKIGAYSKHLLRWLRYFSKQQLHLVSGDELIKSPYEEIQALESFLNLTPFIKREHFIFNKTKGFYCFDKQISEPVQMSKTDKINLHCLGSEKGRSHVVVSEKILAMLRDYYRPFNKELYTLVGRDFGWP